MTTTEKHLPAATRHRRVMLALLAIAAAPTAWFTHLAVVYWLVPVTCNMTTVMPIHVVTVTAIAVAIGAAVLATRALRNGPTKKTSVFANAMHPSPTRHDARPTLASIGAVMGVYFAFVIAMTGLVGIFVDPCG